MKHAATHRNAARNPFVRIVAMRRRSCIDLRPELGLDTPELQG